MNKNLLIALIIILLAGAVGAWYWQSNRSVADEAVNTNSQSADNSQETADSVSGEQTKRSSLRQLMMAGTSMQCDYQSTDPDGGLIEGEVFVSGETRFRGNFSSTMPNEGVMVTHVIRDGDVQYMWSDGQTQGVKMTIDDDDLLVDDLAEDEETVEDSAEDTSSDEFNFDDSAEFDFNCRPWIPNDDSFTPPADVQFMDMSEQFMPTTDQAPVQGDEDQCGICDQLPAGSAQQQCRASLGC